jgi:hypothetical protein
MCCTTVLVKLNKVTLSFQIITHRGCLMTEGICMPTTRQASLESLSGVPTYIHIRHSMSSKLINPSALNKRAAEHAIKSNLTHPLRLSSATLVRDSSLFAQCSFQASSRAGSFLLAHRRRVLCRANINADAALPAAELSSIPSGIFCNVWCARDFGFGASGHLVLSYRWRGGIVV